MTADCSHDDLGEHPAGIVCLGCGEVLDRAAGRTAAAAREEARKARVADLLAETRQALADSKPTTAGQEPASRPAGGPDGPHHPTAPAGPPRIPGEP